VGEKKLDMVISVSIINIVIAIYVSFPRDLFSSFVLQIFNCIDFIFLKVGAEVRLNRKGLVKFHR